jgi:hypothetical protein
MPVKPLITSWGTSYGVDGGNKLNDYKPPGDIVEALLNDGRLKTLEEFSDFDRTIHDWVLSRLGYPVVRVELTPTQLKTCIDEAVTRLYYHAPQFTTQFAVFQTTVGENNYEIPTWILNNLTYVVYKKTLLTIQAESGSLMEDLMIKFFQDSNLISGFRMGEFYLVQQHLEMMRKILSQEGSWDVINNKYLQIAPTPVSNNQQVILEYRALDSNTMHPAYKNWIQKFALACAKELLGEIRGKYKSLPGPQGGAQLNGEELVARGREDKDKLIEELLIELEEPGAFTMF